MSSHFSYRKNAGLLSSVLVSLVLLVSGPAMADLPATPPVSAPVPEKWSDTIKYSGHVEGGMAFNTASPNDNENVGSLFTDKSNELQINQVFLTMERPVSSDTSKFDWGFKLQGLFGTDARYTHSLGEFDHFLHSRYQVDINEATVNLHLASVFKDGIDLKIGQFPSPFSAESIDATANSLYSHSYIFNFGVPFKSTGLLATAHVNETLDVIGGIDTGVNGGITADGINNHNLKGQFGVGLNNLLGGALSVIALSHVGTDDPSNTVPKEAMRFLNDVTATFKANDKLTLTTDVNYAEEDSTKATAYGVAQYATYVLNDHVTLVGRAEVWRDNGGFVAAFPGDFDNANAQRGLTNGSQAAPHTTYGEITLGVNYKPELPADLGKLVDGLVIRPEFRIDDALSGSKPFNQGKDGTSFTPAVDVVIPF